MTREEAIIRLKEGEPFSEIYDPVWDEALNMAISALSENKGEWIFYDEEFYQQGRFANVAHRIRECSICHHKIADFVGNMDFCPNCGADMREPKGLMINVGIVGKPSLLKQIVPTGGEMRCNTCKNSDDEFSGECYECIKGIFDHYEPQESEDKE